MAQSQEPKMSSFIPPRLMKLGGIAAWPNAAVPLGAQVNEFIPEICKVPYDFLFRDEIGRASCRERV